MSTAAFTLDRLHRLGDVVLRLRTSTRDSETLAALADSLADVIHSYYWERRGDRAAGGLAVTDLTDAERAERQKLVDSVMTDATGAAPSQDDVTFALNIAAADLYAAFDGSRIDFAAAAAHWNVLKPLWSRHGLSEWGEPSFLGFISYVIAAATQAGEDIEAALLFTDIIESLETAPVDPATMSPRRRNRLIETASGIFSRFDAPGRSFLPVDELWQRLTRLPWIGAGGEDETQRPRVEFAVAALRASLKTGSGDRPAMWRSLAQWSGQSRWPASSSAELQTAPLTRVILMETDHQVLIRDALGALIVVLGEPPQQLGQNLLVQGIASGVAEWLPAQEYKGVAGATVLTDLLLEALGAENSNKPSVLTGALVSLWLHLALLGETELVLSAMDRAWAAPATRQRPWLVLAVLRAATALVGFPAIGSTHLERFAAYAHSATFATGILHLGEAAISLIDTLTDPSGAALDPVSFTYFPARSRMDANAAATLDRKLAALLAARIAASGAAGDHASAKRDLDHLNIIALRTPSTEAIGGIEAYMAILDAADPALPGLIAGRDKIARQAEHRAMLSRSQAAIAADINDPLLFPYLASPSITEMPPPRLELGSAAWPFPPIHPGSWHEVEDAAEAADLMSRLDRAMAARPFFQSIRQRPMRAMRTHQPSCYEAATVVEVLLGAHRNEDEAQSVLFMLGKTVAFPIEGRSPRIYSFNQTEKILLETPDQAADYARLFCSIVQGEAGPFMLIESIEDVEQRWSAGPPSNVVELSEQIISMAPQKNNENLEIDEEIWQIETTVYYDKDLFTAVFAITLSGKIHMISDSPIASGIVDKLPTIRDGLRSWFHDGEAG